MSNIFKGRYKATASQKRAREIMGKNFLGIEEASKHFGVSFRKELARFDEIPFPETMLPACKDTHILFPGFPLTILDIISKVSRNLFWQQKDVLYKQMEFAKEDKVELRWYLIQKDIVYGSKNKPYQKQLAMLWKDEEVPRACEMVYMIILYFLATGTRLFEDNFARCQDGDSYKRIRVGFFDDDEDGLVISYWSDEAARSIGVGASRKIPS